MARERNELTQEQNTEIREALKQAKKRQDYRRLLILQAATTGKKKQEEIAWEHGVSKSMVSHLLGAYRKQGMAGVLTQIKGGNRRNMSVAEEAEILEAFQLRAEKGEMLEVAQIHAAYEEKLGRPVSKSVVYYMLGRHQWRKVMPRSKHPKKASQEDIEAYKKNHGENPNTYEKAP